MWFLKPASHPAATILATTLGITLTLAAPATALAQFNAGRGVVRDLYVQYCAACHGLDLRGGGQGPALIGRPFTRGADDDSVARTISEGVPTTPMIAWKNVLSNNQIRSLVIYLKEAAVLSGEAPVRRPAPETGEYTAHTASFRLERVFTGVSTQTNPDATIWGFVFLPGGSSLATQRDGTIWQITPGGKPIKITGTPAIWRPGAESGMFDIALHPDFPSNGWIYLSFSETREADPTSAKSGMTAIVRGKIRNGQWVDQEYIFRAPEANYTAAHHHFGCRMLFRDGLLYFSIGDRVDQNAAQDLSSPLGKIHRLKDDGGMPADNPFVPTKGALPSVWSYGLRNVQGLAIHPETREIWASEHGPRGGDEINVILCGANYAWPLATAGMNYDGSPITLLTSLEGTVVPKWQWTPSIAPGCAVFYTGDDFPAWKGCLFVGGLWSEELHRLKVVAGRVTEDEVVLKGQGRVRNVMNGPDGGLYVALATGTPLVGSVFRLIPTTPPSKP